jgi:SAM-dependent methyltransferase
MSALAGRRFDLDGRSYAYYVAEGNRTWDNERAVEIPVCWSAVRSHRDPSTVIEVGNVLGHYFDTEHRVLDLHERDAHVTWNADVLEFRPPFAPQLVVSISTLEHVGHPLRPELFRRAVEAIIDWLAPSGRLLFTVPLGYSPAVVEYLERPSPEIRSTLFMRRLTLDNLWEQASFAAVRDCRYDRPFGAANAIAIVEASRR